MDAEATMLAQPCNHKIACVECSSKLALSSETTHSFKCPVCRAEVSSMTSPDMIIQNIPDAFKTFSELNAAIASLKTKLVAATNDEEKNALTKEMSVKLTQQSGISCAFLEGATRSLNAFFTKNPRAFSRSDIGSELGKIKRKFLGICDSYNRCGLLTIDEFTWIRNQIQILNGVDEKLNKPALSRNQIFEMLYNHQRSMQAVALQAQGK